MEGVGRSRKIGDGVISIDLALGWRLKFELVRRHKSSLSPHYDVRICNLHAHA